ncbi:hypothetical protein UY3_18996 [Chelonia mydas]|uniref:Uncharacterized protein n=1 Tax=Chelonia mydas TaxID=8469 RepID=M7AHY9_CHEMY|nr:hypothetical protein UY3_18996 [Chelonia mydas]
MKRTNSMSKVHQYDIDITDNFTVSHKTLNYRSSSLQSLLNFTLLLLDKVMSSNRGTGTVCLQTQEDNTASVNPPNVNYEKLLCDSQKFAYRFESRAPPLLKNKQTNLQYCTGMTPNSGAFGPFTTTRKHYRAPRSGEVPTIEKSDSVLNDTKEVFKPQKTRKSKTFVPASAPIKVNGTCASDFNGIVPATPMGALEGAIGVEPLECIGAMQLLLGGGPCSCFWEARGVAPNPALRLEGDTSGANTFLTAAQHSSVCSSSEQGGALLLLLPSSPCNAWSEQGERRDEKLLKLERSRDELLADVTEQMWGVGADGKVGDRIDLGVQGQNYRDGQKWGVKAPTAQAKSPYSINLEELATLIDTDPTTR